MSEANYLTNLRAIRTMNKKLIKNIFNIKILNDEISARGTIKLIFQKAISFTQTDTDEKIQDRNLEKILSFAGSQSGAFKDMSVEDMRKTRLSGYKCIFDTVIT